MAPEADDVVLNVMFVLMNHFIPSLSISGSEPVAMGMTNPWPPTL